MASITVIGASRGIGEAVASHCVARADRVISVARTQAEHGEWIRADVSTPEGIQAVVDAVGQDCLDALLYMGGTWEELAFTEAYSFEACSDDAITRVLNVNLLAPIRIVQALLPALRRSANPKIIFMSLQKNHLAGRVFPSAEMISC